MTQGQGISCNTTPGADMSMNQSLRESYTTTSGDESTSMEVEIEITFQLMPRPEKIVILQMDQNSQVVSQQVYEPGEVPAKLILEGETEYVLVETHQETEDETKAVIREVYNRDERKIETFSANEQGIRVKNVTQ